MNILWDFDGTLFDTYPAYTKIFRKVLKENVDEKDIYQQLIKSFSHAFNHYNLTEDQLKEFRVLESNLSPQDTKPFDMVEEVLQAATKNVIMTHKDRSGMIAILEYFGFEKYFSDMITIDDGYPRKPDSTAYEYLHKKHQLDLVIGDRELDLIPGKKLGIATCIYRNESEIADYHIDHYAELLHWMQTKI